MSGEIQVTIMGNLTADPELRFTPSGDAVTSFTVASTARTFDRKTNSWKDGDATFMRCSAWKQLAENIAESLQRGQRVVVHGTIKQRSYETREGEKRTVIEMTASDVGPSLQWAHAKVTRASRQSETVAPQNDIEDDSQWETATAEPPAGRRRTTAASR